MRSVALLLPAALAVALSASRGRAEDALKVKVIAVNENRQDDVEGTITARSFTVQGKHGTMEVPASRLASLGSGSGGTAEGGTVIILYTVDQQRFEGEIVAPKTLEIAGKYGRFSTSWADVREMKVVDRPVSSDDDEEVDDAPDAWQVRIETEGGDQLSGPLWSIAEGAITSVEIESDFGSLDFNAKKIRSIEFNPAPEKALDGGQIVEPVTEERPPGFAPESDLPVDTRKQGTIITTDGRKLSGTITVPAGWSVKTDLGYLSLKADRLKRITFEGPAETPDMGDDRPARPAGSRPNPAGDKTPTRPEQAAPARNVPDPQDGGVAPERP